MKSISFLNCHVYLSVILYITSLFFPACYLGESRQPQSSMELLGEGVFGVFVGAFSWYANPLYWIALFQRDKPKTIIFCIFSLLLALSFLFYERVAYVELDFQQDITSLGWGFFLWVLAIAVLLFGQMAKFSGGPSFFIPILTLVPIVVSSQFIQKYYYVGENSQYQVQLQRDQIYDSECKDAKTEIFSIVTNVKSVYLEGVPGEYHRNLFWWKRKEGGFSINSYVNSGYLMFGEENNNHRQRENPEMNTPYIRYSIKHNSYVNEIMSDVSITVERSSYPLRVNLIVETIIIKDRRSGKVLVKSKSVYDENSRRLCGAINKSEYSPETIIVKNLGLKKQFSSIYGK